jgi:uncharacterized membrane protein YfcA
MCLAAVVFALGFAISLLSGLLGIGGGIVLAPALLYLPSLLGLGGLDMKAVSGLTITQGLFACLSGMVRHDRHRAVNHRLVAWMGATFFASALTGALLSRWVTSEVLMMVFAGMAVVAAVLMWVPVEPSRDEASSTSDFDLRIAVPIAVAVGLLGGLVGQGGSFILIPLLLHALRIPTRIAIGSNLAIVALSSLAGFVGKIATGQVPLLLALALVAGAIPAAQLGSILSFRTPPRWLRYLLAALVLLAAVKMTSDVLACDACLRLRRSQGSAPCPGSALQDVPRVIRESERSLTLGGCR